jgi:hypothetical protein
MMGVLSRAADVHHEKHALTREVGSLRPLILRSACGASVGQWAPGAAVTVRGSGCQGLSGTMVRDFGPGASSWIGPASHAAGASPLSLVHHGQCINPPTGRPE